jgi:HD-GYP domain-containing protein (c-di-GMP phosphodiesterase class II)
MSRSEFVLPGDLWRLGAEEIRAFHKTAVDLVVRFHIVLKIAKIHDPKNDAFVEQGRLLFNGLARLLKDKEITFRVRQGAFLLGDVRLKPSLGTYPIFKFLSEEFGGHELEALAFRPGLTLGELDLFMPILARRDRTAGSPFASLQAACDAAGITHVGLEKATAPRTASSLNRGTARLFFLAVAHLRDSFERNERNLAVKVHMTRRLMQSIYNHIVENESFVFGMTNLKNYDEYTLNHSVNVCLLATALGRRLGLTRSELVDLGIAAFFHDLGKIDMPIEILNKPDKLSPGERRVIEQHPFKGAEKLVLLKESRRLPLQAIHVALEHHLKQDRGGYPHYFRTEDANVFSKIVKVVDYFDAVTTRRVYRRDALTRSEALSLMSELAGSEFHPAILKAFVIMMGVFPIGSLVVMTSGELGIVFDVNPDPRLALRPKVKLIADAAGDKVDGEIVDLADRDPETGRFLRTISGSLDPQVYGIEVADYFLAEAQ